MVERKTTARKQPGRLKTQRLQQQQQKSIQTRAAQAQAQAPKPVQAVSQEDINSRIKTIEAQLKASQIEEAREIKTKDKAGKKQEQAIQKSLRSSLDRLRKGELLNVQSVISAAEALGDKARREKLGRQRKKAIPKITAEIKKTLPTKGKVKQRTIKIGGKVIVGFLDSQGNFSPSGTGDNRKVFEQVQKSFGTTNLAEIERIKKIPSVAKQLKSSKTEAIAQELKLTQKLVTQAKTREAYVKKKTKFLKQQDLMIKKNPEILQKTNKLITNFKKNNPNVATDPELQIDMFRLSVNQASRELNLKPLSLDAKLSLVESRANTINKKIEEIKSLVPTEAKELAKLIKPTKQEQLINKVVTGQTLTSKEQAEYSLIQIRQGKKITKQQYNNIKKFGSLFLSPVTYGKNLQIRIEKGEATPLFNDMTRLGSFFKGVGTGALKETGDIINFFLGVKGVTINSKGETFDGVIASGGRGLIEYGMKLSRETSKGKSVKNVMGDDLKRLVTATKIGGKAVIDAGEFAAKHPFVTSLIVGAAITDGVIASKEAFLRNPSENTGRVLLWLFPGKIIKGVGVGIKSTGKVVSGLAKPQLKNINKLKKYFTQSVFIKVLTKNKSKEFEAIKRTLLIQGLRSRKIKLSDKEFALIATSKLEDSLSVLARGEPKVKNGFVSNQYKKVQKSLDKLKLQKEIKKNLFVTAVFGKNKFLKDLPNSRNIIGSLSVKELKKMLKVRKSSNVRKLFTKIKSKFTTLITKLKEPVKKLKITLPEQREAVRNLLGKDGIFYSKKELSRLSKKGLDKLMKSINQKLGISSELAKLGIKIPNTKIKGSTNLQLRARLEKELKLKEEAIITQKREKVLEVKILSDKKKSLAQAFEDKFDLELSPDMLKLLSVKQLKNLVKSKNKKSFNSKITGLKNYVKMKYNIKKKKLISIFKFKKILKVPKQDTKIALGKELRAKGLKLSDKEILKKSVKSLNKLLTKQKEKLNLKKSLKELKIKITGKNFNKASVRDLKIMIRAKKEKLATDAIKLLEKGKKIKVIDIPIEMQKEALRKALRVVGVKLSPQQIKKLSVSKLETQLKTTKEKLPLKNRLKELKVKMTGKELNKISVRDLKIMIRSKEEKLVVEAIKKLQEGKKLKVVDIPIELQKEALRKELQREGIKVSPEKIKQLSVSKLQTKLKATKKKKTDAATKLKKDIVVKLDKQVSDLIKGTIKLVELGNKIPRNTANALLRNKKAQLQIQKQLQKRETDLFSKEKEFEKRMKTIVLKPGAKTKSNFKFQIGTMQDIFKEAQILKHNKKLLFGSVSAKLSAFDSKLLKLLKLMNEVKFDKNVGVYFPLTQMKQKEVRDVISLIGLKSIPTQEFKQSLESLQGTKLSVAQVSALGQRQVLLLSNQFKPISIQRLRQITTTKKLAVPKKFIFPSPNFYSSAYKNRVAIYEGYYNERRLRSKPFDKKTNPVVPKKIRLITTRNRALKEIGDLGDRRTVRSIQVEIVGLTNKKMKDIGFPKVLNKYVKKKSKNTPVLKLVEKPKHLFDTKTEIAEAKLSKQRKKVTITKKITKKIAAKPKTTKKKAVTKKVVKKSPPKKKAVKKITSKKVSKVSKVSKKKKVAKKASKKKPSSKVKKKPATKKKTTKKVVKKKKK